MTSVDNMRKKSYFLDQPLDATQEAHQRVEQARKQLNEMINNLDNKIKRRIQVNQSKMLFAYRNHLERITKQLKMIQQTNRQNQQKFSSDQTIIHLSKQCALFRQQAMRLHSQLEDTLLDADVYKRKAELAEEQVKNTNKLLKNMIAKTKRLISQKILIKQELQLLKQSITSVSKNQNPNNTQEEENNNNNNPNNKTLKNKNLKLSIPYFQFKHNRDNSSIKNDFSHLQYQLHQQQLLTNINKNQSIFHNDRLTDIHNNNNLSARNKSYITKTRNKTEHSVKSYRNFVSSLQHNHDNNKSTPKNHNNNNQHNKQILYNNIQARQQIKIFYNLLKQINTIKDCLRIDQGSYGIQSKSVYELLNDDEDLFKIFKILFPNIDIQANYEQNGVMYSAKLKNSKKSLVQLSSEAMKRISLQKNCQRIIPQTAKAKRNMSLFHDDNIKSVRYQNDKNKNISFATNNNNNNNKQDNSIQSDFFQKQDLLPQHKNNTNFQNNNNQKTIKKINQCFKKKNITRQDRLKNYGKLKKST